MNDAGYVIVALIYFIFGYLSRLGIESYKDLRREIRK